MPPCAALAQPRGLVLGHWSLSQVGCPKGLQGIHAGRPQEQAGPDAQQDRTETSDRLQALYGTSSTLHRGSLDAPMAGGATPISR